MTRTMRIEIVQGADRVSLPGDTAIEGMISLNRQFPVRDCGGIALLSPPPLFLSSLLRDAINF